MDDEQHLVDAVDRISQTSEDRTKLWKRKVNVRRAHRVSVTKSVNQIEDAIESHDRHRLKLLKQSLTDKLAMLAKLDDDIMELTGEDDLETEVEQADEIRDKISLAILKMPLHHMIQLYQVTGGERALEEMNIIVKLVSTCLTQVPPTSLLHAFSHRFGLSESLRMTQDPLTSLLHQC